MFEQSFLWGMGMAAAFSVVGILFSRMEEVPLSCDMWILQFSKRAYDIVLWCVYILFRCVLFGFVLVNGHGQVRGKLRRIGRW